MTGRRRTGLRVLPGVRGLPGARVPLAVRVLLAAGGAVAARAALRRVAGDPRSAALARTNFRDRPVTLAGGPALALAATAGAAVGAVADAVAGAVLGGAAGAVLDGAAGAVLDGAAGGMVGAGAAGAAGAGPRTGITGALAGGVLTGAAALAAGLGAGAVGLYDDLVGGRPGQRAKGFRGHLAALARGRVTSGLVKVAGVGLVGLGAAALLPAHPRRRAADVLLGAGVIAGTANLVNLLDLRPGRALKAGLLIAGPVLPGPGGSLVAGPAGAAAALLPDDLGERIMLGDTGANALGALLGVALAARTGTAGRAALLAGVAGLTAASERVSFTEVIARTPGLRELDALGRRPA
jgi:UDP-N-acetylmuramyl pentapeptide phosphotransferase/UDP-N-acetylglucosamine-1-phosphate transferase